MHKYNERTRSNSYPSIKNYIKRTREEENSEEESEEVKISQRSKKTNKSANTAVPVENKETTKNEMDDLKEMIMNLTAVVNDGFRNVKEMGEKLDTMEAKWRDESRAMKQVIEKNQEKTDKLEDKVLILEGKLEKYEKEKKANNVVIKNMPIEGLVTQRKVEDFLMKELKIPVEVTDAFKIGKIPGKEVIVAKLKDRSQKIKVMENKNKLKGTRTYIESDLTSFEKEIQDKIWDHARDDMKDGRRVRVGFQRLYRDGKTYIWDKKANDLKLNETQAPPAKN